jgi:hypothetical protein
VDILVDLGDCGVGVESKIFGAEDQAGQLTEYASELTKRFRDFKLLYLAYDTSGPSELSLPKDERQELGERLIVVPCAEFLHNWLDACGSVCKAEKIRWFLRDFGLYIEQHQGGHVAEADRGDNDLIFSFVFKDKDDLEVALKVGARDEQIRRKIIADFGMSLIHELESALDSVWRIENQGMFDRQKGLRIFKSAWQGKYWIELAPDHKDGRDMFVTVRNSGDPSANDLIKSNSVSMC